MKSRHLSGFTLVETTITLFIICSLMLITNLQVNDFQTRQAEKLALSDFQSYWKNSLSYSFLTDKPVMVNFFHDEIQFNSQQHQVNVTLPKTLRPIADDIVISKSGVSGPHTIKFESLTSQKNYFYKINMDWGLLIGPEITRIHPN